MMTTNISKRRLGQLRTMSATAGMAIALLAVAPSALPQQGFFTREDVIKYTPEWKGDRFPDGRPKVADSLLDRMKTVTLEEAWAVLRDAGYTHQYEDGWLRIHPDKVLVGRALTAQWMPRGPDVQKVVEAQGKLDHRIGSENAWPVDMLQQRDVYVCDHFGLKKDGPSIGDNVGNAIYARSGNGIVYNGAVRDIEGLEELPNFVSYVRFYDPSHHYGSLRYDGKLNSTMVGINGPTRIGEVLVMPGDVVLGKDGGVLFIPPQVRGKGGEIFRDYPAERHLRSPAATGTEVHRGSDRREMVRCHRAGFHGMAES